MNKSLCHLPAAYISSCPRGCVNRIRAGGNGFRRQAASANDSARPALRRAAVAADSLRRSPLREAEASPAHRSSARQPRAATASGLPHLIAALPVLYRQCAALRPR